MDAELLAWLRLDPSNVALWKQWGQTEEDRAAIREYFAECAAVQARQEVARRIEATDTRDETPVPSTARVLFPVWEADAPLETALQLAVARAHFEAA